jgi:hypothetical protein
VRRAEEEEPVPEDDDERSATVAGRLGTGGGAEDNEVEEGKGVFGLDTDRG